MMKGQDQLCHHPLERSHRSNDLPRSALYFDRDLAHCFTSGLIFVLVLFTCRIHEFSFSFERETKSVVNWEAQVRCRNPGSNSSPGVTRLWITHLDYALLCSKESVCCKYSIFSSLVVVRMADKAATGRAEPILDFYHFSWACPATWSL